MDSDDAFLAHPSSLELVQRYLRPRVDSGEPSSCSWIHEADLYAADPDDLKARYAAATAGDGESAWYFFSPLRIKAGFKERKHRAVPSGRGSWFSERAAKPVVGARLVVVGKKQNFCFTEKGEEGRAVRSRWLMTELRLAGGGVEDRESLTLCKMYDTPRQKPAAAAEAVRPRTETVPSAGPPPEHGAPSPTEEAAPSPHAEGDIVAATTPSPRSLSDTPAEEAAVSDPRSSHDAPGGTPPTVGRTAMTAVPRAPSPCAEGTREWVLIQIGLGDPEPTSAESSISLRRVYQMRRLEDGGGDDDSTAAPLAQRKRKFQECSGWLMLESAHSAKKPALCHGCLTA